MMPFKALFPINQLKWIVQWFKKPKSKSEMTAYNTVQYSTLQKTNR